MIVGIAFALSDLVLNLIEDSEANGKSLTVTSLDFSDVDGAFAIALLKAEKPPSPFRITRKKMSKSIGAFIRCVSYLFLSMTIV